MKRLIFALLFLFVCSSAFSAAAEEKPLFGPVKYDVKERYGKENVYTATFTAQEGIFILKVQNGGDKLTERVEFIELTLNGEKLLKNDKYDYRFIACVVPLHKENTFTVVLKDAPPAGLKRPPLPPRFATISALPLSIKLARGAYGVNSWGSLNELSALIQKIKSPESAALAVSSVNLEADIPARAEALRKLSDRKDASAQDFITAVFRDDMVSPDVRGEAALALGVLGDKASVPLLINGVLDPEEKIRLGSTRALSFYKEEDTSEPLAKMLERLDAMRRDAVIHTIVEAGWKPVGTLMTLAQSTDPYVSNTAIELLGPTKDPRAAELLLKLLDKPEQRDVRKIIKALGESGDRRALGPLLQMAKDPAKWSGKEADLGEALAGLGDEKAAPVIAEMIKKTGSRNAQNRLAQAYKKLTGKDYE